jgi:hypothetical protein
MNPITSSLKPRMQGPAVTNLQDALQLCLDRGALLANDGGTRQNLSALLKDERAAQTHGDGTSKLVTIFQQERQLFGPGGGASGEVDQPTANALNALLNQWGQLDQPVAYQVDGTVFSRISAGVGGLRVVIVDKGVGGDVQLAQATTDDRGAYQATFSDTDVRRRGKAQPDLQADKKRGHQDYHSAETISMGDTPLNPTKTQTSRITTVEPVPRTIRCGKRVTTASPSQVWLGHSSFSGQTLEQQMFYTT